jgi:Tol biopolymer transport system component
MKTLPLLLITLLAISCTSQTHKVEKQNPTGKYIDTELPGMEAKLFAPGFISTEMGEINAVFTPDFQSFYYSIRMPNGQLVLMETKFDGKQWSEPVVWEFSGEYADADPFITYDGKWMYFISKRPIDSAQAVKKDWDIWRTQKVDGKWSEPEWLGEEINSPQDDLYPSLTRDGNMYFSTARNGYWRDIYCAKKEGEGFAAPERLSDTVNQFWEGDVLVSPDEDYLIFASHGRKEGAGLYISFNEKGEWKTPKHMGEKINIHGGEWCPMLSPDGKYFFFTSNYRKDQPHEKLTFERIKKVYHESFTSPQMGKSDVYWIDAKIIEKGAK